MVSDDSQNQKAKLKQIHTKKIHPLCTLRARARWRPRTGRKEHTVRSRIPRPLLPRVIFPHPNAQTSTPTHAKPLGALDQWGGDKDAQDRRGESAPIEAVLRLGHAGAPRRSILITIGVLCDVGICSWVPPPLLLCARQTGPLRTGEGVLKICHEWGKGGQRKTQSTIYRGPTIQLDVCLLSSV